MGSYLDMEGTKDATNIHLRDCRQFKGRQLWQCRNRLEPHFKTTAGALCDAVQSLKYSGL